MSFRSLNWPRIITAVAFGGAVAGIFWARHRRNERQRKEAAGRDRFSEMASTYDQHAVSNIINTGVMAIFNEKLPFQLNKQHDVLDFACGPATVDMLLADRVRSITSLDSAPGMIDEVKRKLEENKFDNVFPVLGELSPDTLDELLPPSRQFDLIWSTMAFHHLADPAGMLSLLAKRLKPGGHVLLVDMVDCDETRAAMRARSQEGGGHGHSHGSHGSHRGGHGHSHGGHGGGEGHSHGGGQGHGGEAAEQHDHSHGGGHGHSHGGGHGHSHGPAAAGAPNTQGERAHDDVFHDGFTQQGIASMMDRAGLRVVSQQIPSFVADLRGFRVPVFHVIAASQ